MVIFDGIISNYKHFESIALLIHNFLDYVCIIEI